jgi:GNAT superfamily N-acetyltransferase
MVAPPAPTHAVDFVLDAFLRTWIIARRSQALTLSTYAGIHHIRFGVLHQHQRARSDEFFITAAHTPQQVAAVISHSIDNDSKLHWLTVVTHQPDLAKHTYTQHGYTHKYDEALMLLPNLVDATNANPPARIFTAHKVQSQAEANWVNTHDSARVDATRLHEPNFGDYYIKYNDMPVAMGRMGLTSDGIAGPDNIFTMHQYRRRGFATALMQTMHADAVACGCAMAVLLASAEGQAMYLKLGYQIVASACVFER